MNKKKIGIIAISIMALIIVGLGFNMLFSKANNSDKVSSSNSKDIDTNKNNEEDSDKEQDTNVENEDNLLEEEETNEEVDKKDTTNEEEITEEVVENTEIDNSNDNSISNEPNNTTPSAPVENNNNNNNSATVEETKPTTPVQPEVVKETVTIAISCKTAINSGLNSTAGFTHLPADGMILYTTKVEINEGDTVFNILQRITKQNGIHMEYTGSGSTIYIEGINNLYEFDGGQNSGWMYSVNGWYPNYGCGSYTVKANDVIQWNYTLDLGNDLGAGRN